MNLASGQLDVYRNQLLELHRLVGIQAGLTGSDPLAKQEEVSLSSLPAAWRSILHLDGE